MGYVPPEPPAPELNMDRHGMPRDFATYMWLVYQRRVVDKSPARLAFLQGSKDAPRHFGQQMAMR